MLNLVAYFCLGSAVSLIYTLLLLWIIRLAVAKAVVDFLIDHERRMH